MVAKYSQAPISEVICGIFFEPSILSNGSAFFQMLTKLTNEYPQIHTHPTLPEEEVINGSIHANPNYPNAGFTAYRFVSEDNRWQIIAQQNMLSLHWNRQDSEAVGNYPGFTAVYKKFYELLNSLKTIVDNDNNLFSNIKTCYLAYIDRVDLETFKKQGQIISDILTLVPPGFSINGKNYQADNYFARYSTLCDEVDGYSIMSINSPTLIPIGQLLIVDNKIKGVPKSLDKIDEWFETAHAIQHSFFESIFRPEILNHWR